MKDYISPNKYMAMWDRVVNTYSDSYEDYFQSYKAEKGMLEIIMVGRAGQGVWSAGELLGATAVDKGKYSKVIFTMPGERRNSPTRSFIRVADQPVHFPVSFIHRADDVIILEEDMLDFTSVILDFHVPTFTHWMRPDGFCLVNSPKSPGELEGDIAGKIVTVDATKIALEHLQSPFFMNMALIGAYLAVRKAFQLGDVESAIKNYKNPRGHRIFAGELGDKNIRALRAGYEMVKV